MRKSIFTFVVLSIFSLSLTQCTSTKKFDQKINEHNCEEAFNIVPEKQTDYKLVSKVQELSSTVMSYSATGVAYTAEILWDTTTTLTAVVVLCAPAIATTLVAAKQSSNGGVAMGPLCLPADIKKLRSPTLGHNTYRNTRLWRCPNVDGISKSIRKVAKCYADRNTEEDRAKALKALDSVSNSGSFYRCLSKKELEAFHNDYSNLEPKATQPDAIHN